MQQGEGAQMFKKVIFVGILFCDCVLIGCGESRERHIYLCYDPAQYACSNQGDDMKLCILTEVADGEIVKELDQCVYEAEIHHNHDTSFVGICGYVVHQSDEVFVTRIVSDGDWADVCVRPGGRTKLSITNNCYYVSGFDSLTCESIHNKKYVSKVRGLLQEVRHQMKFEEDKENDFLEAGQ